MRVAFGRAGLGVAEDAADDVKACAVGDGDGREGVTQIVQPDIRRKVHGVWSVGCACWLYPRWYRNNKWNHGYAVVELSANGDFQVRNRAILRDGRII